jgi:2-polyprenyl-6-methoxyphenol hydroxylase-like FAD-dependent oxidoreductase
LQSGYIIGCDGAHSKVRTSIPIKFDTISYNGTFTLADVHVTSELMNGEIHNIVSKNGFLALFPQKDEPYCRVVYVLKDSNRPKNVDIEVFQNELNEIKRKGLIVRDPKWITRFKVYKALANKFQFENIFLVGDAAHIHSPIGGQGMNLGIQDALNLSFKFSQYTLGSNNLSNYTGERRPFAIATLRTTDRITQFGLKDSVFTKLAREIGLPLILNNSCLQTKIARSLAQVESATSELARQFGP